MTDPSASSGARPVLPAARPERSARRARATAVGLLAAAALGAGVLLVPGGSPEASDELTSTAAVQQVAHPAQPAVPAAAAPTATTQAAAQPATQPALQFRDPFRPLVSDAGEQAPITAPDTSVPAVVSQPVDDSGSGFETPSLPDFEVPQAPAPLPAPRDTSAGAPAAGGASLVGRRLSLTRVEPAGEDFVAVLSLEGTPMRVAVGASFGPGGELLLLSLQQGPADGQWTAVVQRGRGEPFDVSTGTPVRLQ